MKAREFRVHNTDGESLAVVEVLPDKPVSRSLPAVFLCHGFGYYKEEGGLFTGLAERLAVKGYAVYYFDFSGCGESEGDYSETLLTKLVQDLRAVYETVIEYDYVDGTKLSVIGQSFGTSVCVAAQFHDWQRIVLCGSFSNANEVISRLFPNFDETKVVSRPRSNGRVTTINPPFWTDLNQYNFAALISKYECPILFIHGQLDDIVEPEQMRPLFKVARHPVGPVLLEKSNHGLLPEREKAFQAVADFFPLATT